MSKYLDTYARMIAVNDGMADWWKTPDVDIENYIVEEVGGLPKPTGEHVNYFMQRASIAEQMLEAFSEECHRKKKDRKPQRLTKQETKDIQKLKGRAAMANKLIHFCDKWRQPERTEEELFEAYIRWRKEVRDRENREVRLIGFRTALQRDYERFNQ